MIKKANPSQRCHQGHLFVCSIVSVQRVALGVLKENNLALWNGLIFLWTVLKNTAKMCNIIVLWGKETRSRHDTTLSLELVFKIMFPF